MDKIKKFLKKVSKKECLNLENKIASLISKKLDNFNVIKIKGTKFYRVKVGKYRIIFYYIDNDIIVDDIKLRNENTYKNLK